MLIPANKTMFQKCFAKGSGTTFLSCMQSLEQKPNQMENQKPKDPNQRTKKRCSLFLEQRVVLYRSFRTQ